MSETFRTYDESYPPDIYGPPVVPPPPNATGATAGAPGAFTPSPNTPPADAAQATAWAVVASPATDWTLGQYVQGSAAGAAGEMNWSGTAWVAGKSAVAAEAAKTTAPRQNGKTTAPVIDVDQPPPEPTA